MLFRQKLTFLINNFNSSNSKLARGINVDPTLVSKWVNGKRTPPPTSHYFNLIATYFSKIAVHEYQQDILNSMLKSPISNLDLDNLSDRKRALYEWLASKTELLSDNLDEGQTIDSLPLRLPKLDIDVKLGEIGHYELFKGKLGKRQAVLNFLCSILTVDEPLELQISCQEDILWLIEDQEFLVKWSAILKEILDRGHKIVIIHIVNHNPAQITAIMNYWMPLHLSGQVESYYHPKYEEPLLKKTIFIARGIASILSISPNDENVDTKCTFLFRDTLVIELMERNFLSYMTNCRPLVCSFNKNRINELHSEILDMEKRPGSYLTLKNELSSITIPTELYSSLMQHSGLSPDESKDRISLHRQRLNSFLHNLKYFQYREIYCIESIDKLIDESGCIYSGNELFIEQSIRLEPIELLQHIANIIRLLEKYEQYEIILLNRKTGLFPENLQLSIKEDFSAMIFASKDDGNKPFALITYEGNILQTFEDNLTNICTQVPKNNRSKDWVIEKLRQRVIRLEKMVGCSESE